MFRVIFEPERGQRVPIRVWARTVSVDTIRQLQRLAAQAYVVEFVAAMADAHVAEGVAVGSVFALEVVVRRLARAIPCGDDTHRGHGVAVPDGLLAPPLSTHSLEHTREALAGRHLATLGGGNHFLELDRDPDGGLWLLVHSGSRGLGAAVAAHHARAAGHDVNEPLRGLDTTTEAGAAYLGDLTWALAFARANREALATRALEVVGDVLHGAIDPLPCLDVHHNFVARETWFGRELLVHRKGAVALSPGTLGLIPGSMGTASYVVEGLVNDDAFGSCSHGAGRLMSRKEARAAIRPKTLAQAMRRVVYPEGLERDLVEEAPAAYREIAEVLEDQEDLVRRRMRLEPIAVLKG